MKKLQQDVLDFCIENQDATSKKVVAEISKILSIIPADELKVDHEQEHWTDALYITKEMSIEWDTKLKTINDHKFKTQSEYYEAIHNGLPKIALIICMYELNKKLNALGPIASILNGFNI